MTTESFNQFVGRNQQAPKNWQAEIPRLVFEARQGGRRGSIARATLQGIPGGMEALVASNTPAPAPRAPAPPPVASAPPAPMAPPPEASPSFFDQTLGRGIGAAGRGVLGVGRFVQPVTTPILENVGKGFDLFGGTFNSFVDLAPGQLYAGQNQGRGFNEILQEVAVEKGYSSPRAGGVWDFAGQAQILAEANRRTDMPSVRVNALPGQGIPLPGGKRLNEIDFGVKGAIELLPEIAIGIATGGASTVGSLARKTAVSTANALGADVLALGARGAIGAGRAGTRAVIPQARKLSPTMEGILKAQEARQGVARGAGGAVDPDTIVTPRVGADTRFLELAAAQRGEAERLGTSAMMDAGGSGIRQFLTEAVGDIIQRMSRQMPDDYSATIEKVQRGIRELRRPNFADELESQLRSNYDFGVEKGKITKSFEAHKAGILDIQSQYAVAHSKLPVINQAHRDAQEAAVAFGEQRYADSLAALRRIEFKLGSEEAFDAYRLEGAQPATSTAAARGAGAIDQLPAYEGEAFRTPSGFSQDRGTTAGDVVRYERDELGNVETFSNVTDDMLRELDQYPAEDIVWVGRNREVAARYDNGEGMENVAQSVAGGRVIADIPDGTLVLRPSAKKNATPATRRADAKAVFLEPYVEPVTGNASVVDEAFEVNQTKAVETPAGYSPGLIEDLIPKIAAPAVFRKAIEASKAILRRVPSLEQANQLQPSTLPGMAVSAMVKAAAPRIQSTANRLINEIHGKLREVNPNTQEAVFTFDDVTNKLGRRIKGQTGLRVQNIEGISPKVMGNDGIERGLEANPTIADLAQDYGAYRPFLNPQQREAMEFLRVRANGLAADLEAYGIPVENKIALGEDGFFISRGPTKQETQNLVSGQVRVKGRTYDKSRKYKTQVEALLDKDQINEYLPVWNEMGNWSSEIYETVLDQQAGKFFINYRDPVTGAPIATSVRREEVQLVRAKIRAAMETQKGQKIRVVDTNTAYNRASKAVEDITDELIGLAKKVESATSANQLSEILIRASKDTKQKLTTLENAAKTASGKADIAKMRADDLEDEVDRLLNFENRQSELLGNAEQRLQVIVSTAAPLIRARKEVKDLEGFLQRTVELREKAQSRLVTKRNAEEVAYFKSADADAALANSSGRQRVPLDFLDVPNDAAAALKLARRDLAKMKVQATKRFNEEKARRGNYQTAVDRQDDTNRHIANLRQDLDSLEKKIKAEEFANKDKTTPIAGFRSLNSYELNIADAKTVLRTREGMQGLSGKGSEWLAPIGAYQNLRRTIGATLDDSGISIQGKAFQFSNPREFYAAWKDHLQSLVGKTGRKGKRLQREAMADNIRKFDKESQAAGAPSSHEIIDRMGIRHGGVDTEVTLREDGIAGQFGKLPLLRRANEAFGAFGDMLRLHGARAEIVEYMRLSGKTFDELVADGTARKIGNGVNGITGWTPNGVAGALGDTLLFAPRFFRARIETLHRATQGLDVDFMIDALPFDRQIRRNLNINRGIRNSIDADQLIARRAVMKLVSMGTLITVAANEALGQETDFQLMKNGRMNPNFMSVRLTKIGAPRDWNIFGPYKSMAALLLASAGGLGEKDLGKATDAWLNLSSPIVGDIAEFISFKSVGESRFGETLGEYMVNSHIPFSLQEVPNIIKESATGNPKDAFGGALSIGLETIGEQSSPLSRSDILQDRVTQLFSGNKISADRYDDLEPYEKNDVQDSLIAELEKFEVEAADKGKSFKRFFATIDIINRRRDSQLQEALVFYNAGRRSDGSEYTKREFTDDYFDILDDARERKDQVKETLGVEFKEVVPAADDLEAQALEAWYDASSKSVTPSGSYLPDKLNALRNKVLADYPDQVDYIYRNTNDTPLPAGFLEALVRSGLQSTVDKIMRSRAARQAQGAPAQPVVPSNTLIAPEQPAMGGAIQGVAGITPMPSPLGSNPLLQGLLRPSSVAQ
jgi:hypothetical protein